jgi:hypothetical protein
MTSIEFLRNLLEFPDQYVVRWGSECNPKKLWRIFEVNHDTTEEGTVINYKETPTPIGFETYGDAAVVASIMSAFGQNKKRERMETAAKSESSELEQAVDEPSEIELKYHTLSQKLDEANSLIAKLLPSYKPEDEATLDGLYRILEKGEITIDGDEILHGKWRVFTGPCMRITREPVIFRRLIYAEKNNEYYYLKPNDVIKEGDDSANINSSNWQPVTAYNVGKTADHDFNFKFRRLNTDRDLKDTVDNDTSDISGFEEIDKVIAKAENPYHSVGRRLLSLEELGHQQGWLSHYERDVMFASNFIGQKSNTRENCESPKSWTKPASPEPKEPESGFRWVIVGETIQENDQFWNTSAGKWSFVVEWGHTVSQMLGNDTIRRIVNLGEGYRLLKSWEKLEEGDEFMWGFEWDRTKEPGLTVDEVRIQAHDNLIYRRKIDPGPSCRLLEVGETILAGDEQKSKDIGGDRHHFTRSWPSCVHYVGKTVPNWENTKYVFRRKVEPVATKSLTIGDYEKAAENAAGYSFNHGN